MIRPFQVVQTIHSDASYAYPGIDGRQRRLQPMFIALTAVMLGLYLTLGGRSLPTFDSMRAGVGLGVPGAALGVGAVCLALALFSVWCLEETFGRDLDFVEE